MTAGAPHEARWIRVEPRLRPSQWDLERIVQTAFPGSRVLELQPLPGGLRNANFKLHLHGPPEPVVLRIYEHDPSLCQKELDLIGLIHGSIPVPEVIHAEPRGLEGLPPFAFTRYVDAITLRELKHSGDTGAIAQAASAAGETLAAIGRIKFPRSGWLAPGPTVTEPLLEGADPIPRFVDLCLASENLKRRTPSHLPDRIHGLVWSWAPALASLDESTLVHGDYGKQNLLARKTRGRWELAAVLDWEFAVSGSPLTDLGHLLRYERARRPLLEPHFSQAYRHGGGRLPRDWKPLARLIDLAALCESLTHDRLPEAVVKELVELVRATVDDRDPQVL